MDTFRFIVAKLVLLFLQVETWLFIAFVLIAFLMWRQWFRWAKRLAFLSVFGFAAITIFPIGDILLRPLEEAYPANPMLEHIDGIILLGGGEDLPASNFWEQPQLNSGGDRVVAALTLAHRFPEAKIIIAGGSGRLRDLSGRVNSEARIDQSILLANGISADRIILEENSRNTRENARLVREKVDVNEAETWVLVTSAFHMVRSKREFHAAGWSDVIPYPVDHRSRALGDAFGWDPARNMEMLNIAVKERLGLLLVNLRGG